MIKLEIIEQKEQKFEPIEIKITINSIEDLETFLARFNVSNNDANRNNSYVATCNSVSWSRGGFLKLADLHSKLKDAK